MFIWIPIILGLVTLLFFITVVQCVWKRRYVAALKRGVACVVTGAMTIAVVMVLAMTVLMHNLTYRQPIATIQVTALGNKQHQVALTPVGAVTQQYPLTGDQWMLGANVIVWRHWVQALGIENKYQLDFLMARSATLTPGQPMTTVGYPLNTLNASPLSFWLYQKVLHPYLIDTVEGSAVYMPLQDGAQYCVSLSPSGLVATTC